MGKKKPVIREDPVGSYDDEDDVDDRDRKRKDSGVRRHRSGRSDGKADREA